MVTIPQRIVRASILALIAITALNAQQPPVLTKKFLSPSLAKKINSGPPDTTTLSFTVSNPNNVALSNVAFTDTLPSQLQLATPVGLTGACGAGTITAVDGGASVSLTGGTIPANSECDFAVSVIGITEGVAINTTSTVTANNPSGPGTLTGLAATAQINVIAPPSVTKSFAVLKIQSGGITQLSFTVNNSASNPVTLISIAVTDTLPTGLAVATPLTTTGSCPSGTLLAVNTTIIMSGFSLAPGASCTFGVNIVATGDRTGAIQNTASVSSTNGGKGLDYKAIIIVVGPPVVTKSFTPNGIKVGDSTVLKFTVTNPNDQAIASLSGISFNDPLPTGLQVASSPNLSGSCNLGAVTAIPNATSISLNGIALNPNTACDFSVTLTATALGVKNNTTSAPQSNEGGAGLPATAKMSVLQGPAIAKAFVPAAIPLNGTTTLTFTLTNPNTDPDTGGLTGVGFTDVLPVGLTPSSPVNNCGSGTVTISGTGPYTITYSGGTLAGNAPPCTIVVTITGATAGSKSNTVSASSTNGGNGGTGASTLLVIAPPTINKSFAAPKSVALNGTIQLNFTLTNPNTDPGATLSGVSFTDNLTGMVVATPASVPNTCGGTLTTTSTAIALTGATLAPSGTCTFSVTVQGTTVGSNVNSTGPVHSTEGGNGAASSDTLTVVGAPVVSKSFLPNSIVLNANSTITITITNPAANTVALQGVTVNDPLPAGMVVATLPNITGGCFGGVITAVAGTGSITVSSFTIPINGSCSFTVDVKGIQIGPWLNTATATPTNASPGSGADTLKVGFLAPTIGKAFGAPTIPLNGITTLLLNLSNPNSTQLTNVCFTDPLPAGLAVANPSGLVNTCGGSFTVQALQTTIGFCNITLPPNAGCSIQINVTGTVFGPPLVNTTSTLTSTEAPPGTPATASLTVVGPPSASKAFSPPTVLIGGTSTLTFTLANPAANVVALNNVGFTDNLPAGLVVSTPNGLSGTCGGGTITATAGSSSITLAGATLGVGASCTFSVNVTGSTLGQKNNSFTPGSGNGGNGTPATGTLTVIDNYRAPQLTKAFSTPSVNQNGAVVVTFNLSNPGINPLSNISFTDNLPAGLVISNPNALSNTCSATITATPGTSFINFANASLPGNGSCTFSLSVTATAAPTVRLCNVTSEVTSKEAPNGPPASACITIGSGAIAPGDGLLVSYAANLDAGESYVNLSNSGALGGSDPTGNICINAFVYSPDEQLISCCSCLVTPNALASLSVKNDLLYNPLTPAVPSNVFIKLLTALPVGNTCSIQAPLSLGKLSPGAMAWSSTIHQGPAAGQYSRTETPFIPATLSPSELDRMTNLCQMIQVNGSGYGICRGCRLGGF